MKRSNKIALISAIMTVLFVLSGFGLEESLSNEAVKEIESSFDFSEKKQLTLTNGAGDVEIAGWDEQLVKLEAKIRSDSEENLSKVSIEIKEMENELNIQTVKNQFPAHFNSSVDYSLMVPRTSSIIVKNGTGEVELTNLNGSLDVQLGAGSLALKNSNLYNAYIDFGTGDELFFDHVYASRMEVKMGAVESSRFYKISGEKIDIDSGTGDIEISLTYRPWLIDAKTAIGRIDLHGFEQAKVNRSDHLVGESATITFDNWNNKMDVFSGTGKIKIELLHHSEI